MSMPFDAAVHASAIESLRPKLEAAMAHSGLSADRARDDRLLAYLELVRQWSRVYNLTAIREPEPMLVQHLVDCLAILPAFSRELADGAPVPRVLDVGSGAGLPGVVLAICRPDWRVDCVDTVAKKASFIRQVAGTLGLANLAAIHARVETLASPDGRGYDLITARAFASLPELVRLTRPLLAPEGCWAAMKGKTPTDELAELPPAVEMFHVEPLSVPFLDAERCLVWMRLRR